MDFVSVMLTLIKSKFTPLLTKVKMWTSPKYLKNKGLVKFRAAFAEIFDIKPKNEDDYYVIGRFMVGKKLAMAAVIIVGVLCIVYIKMVTPQPSGDTPYKAYKYNAVALKFKSEKVQILGESGYTAYIGDIEKGIVKGNGTLYRKDGSIVYMGAFEGNAYNGQGKLYYPNQSICYEGEFKDNLYEGEGKLYREDGTLQYEGAFLGGYRDGDGKLYNSSEKLVFTGRYQKDCILYQDFVGKTTTETAGMYTGTNIIYEEENGYCNYMPEIRAIYYGADGSNSLDEEWLVSGIYVLENKILLNGRNAETIPQVKAELGEPVYEGNTALSAKDELALNLTIENGQEEVLFGKAALEFLELFDDVFEIESFERNYLAYLYIFKKEDVVYTFFCKDKDAGFSFYTIE